MSYGLFSELTGTSFDFLEFFAYEPTSVPPFALDRSACRAFPPALPSEVQWSSFLLSTTFFFALALMFDDGVFHTAPFSRLLHWRSQFPFLPQERELTSPHSYAFWRLLLKASSSLMPPIRMSLRTHLLFWSLILLVTQYDHHPSARDPPVWVWVALSCFTPPKRPSLPSISIHV